MAQFHRYSNHAKSHRLHRSSYNRVSRSAMASSNDETKSFFVVGIGASAGGVTALREFFSHVAPGSGMAFVVILHLSPEHESNLAGLLQTQTTMPVMQVTEAVKIEPDHIYVVP